MSRATGRPNGRPPVMKAKQGKLLYLDAEMKKWYEDAAKQRDTNVNALLRQAAREFRERNDYHNA